LVRTMFARAGRSQATTPRRRVVRRAACLLVVVPLVLGSVAAFGATPKASLREGSLVTKARCARNAGVGTVNFISPYGYDASAGIIDVFMAEKLGYFKDLCLKVAINSSAFNGEELVSSGQAQVTGIGSAADAMLSKASGANLVAVATYGDTDPHVIITNSSITSLTQLNGGTLGYFTNNTPAVVAMLEKAGANVPSIHFVSLTNFDPGIVPRGQVDGLQGYASNQPLTLKAENLPFNEYTPAQFGIKGTYNVMQFNGDFLRAHRAVAADFMRADLKALAYCIKNKSACVNYLSSLAAKANEGATFPAAHQLAVWTFESKYITTDKVGGYGVQTPAEWLTEYNEVKKYGSLCGLTSSDFVQPILSTMDPKLVAGLYKGKTLIWPGT
jgi:ABC-type nitrate/sulfonate/bicarbonate transport system substrate-binding protein